MKLIKAVAAQGLFLVVLLSCFMKDDGMDVQGL